MNIFFKILISHNELILMPLNNIISTMLQNVFRLPQNIILIWVLLSVFCLLSESMSATKEIIYPGFEEFINQYHKHYDSQEEWAKRQKIYTMNVEMLKSTNTLSSGVNYFSDWTSVQIQSISNFNLELRAVKMSNKQQNIASTFNFEKQRSLQQSIPKTLDWRNMTIMTSVKNTGLCGASWAFSTVAFFEQLAIINRFVNQTIDLSQMYLIACNPENQQCKSGQVQSSIDLVIERGGLPREVEYPYNSMSTSVSSTCLQTDFIRINNQTRMSYYRISDPQTIKRILFKKPIIAAVCGSDFVTYAPQSSTDSSRTLKCKPQNRIIDHSVLLVGYTETEWIVKNHWGAGWGINGYAYISRNPSEDCCIGDQLHSAGAITASCSVQYCQTCVETDTCYKCQPGRWVKHNTTTGVQTCEPCTETNCAECYNYKGTCKWCADGFGLNSTTGKCMNATIANCNLITSAICFQCKPGYRLSSSRNACNSFCLVKNCDKCPNGPCNLCKPGFSLTSVPVNNKTVQYCQINNCTVSNCTYCNTSGNCVQCASSFTLQTNGSCTTNCTSIAFCVSCLVGSTTCSECIEGRSYNSASKVCEVFSGTTNCKVHRTTCTTCRTGYYLSSGQCLQSCESSSCSTCMPTDITYCLTCANGYFLNRTAVYSVCTANPCNITGCSLCNSIGSCIMCTSKFHVFNTSSNRCQSQCALQNCRDCLPNAIACSYCNVGFGIDSANKLCIPSNITNCVTVFMSNESVKCFTCDTKYYLATTPSDRCLIWCTDQYCEICQITSVHICEKCLDGYTSRLVNGIATCILIPSTMTGCQKISLNQTYCYTCNVYYLRNQKTGVCEKNTQNCPEMCEYCTTNATKYFGCRCYPGFVFDFDTKTCMKTPFNDTNCLMMQFQYLDYYCLECPLGMVLNAAWNGCDSGCLVAGCLRCSSTENTLCKQCLEGSYLSSTGYACIRCPFANCTRCSSAACFDCEVGFELASDGMSCIRIVCRRGFVYDGFGCKCPVGSYQDGEQCKVCGQVNCIECSSQQCFICKPGYFLENNQCKQCPQNCKICNSSQSCLQCSHPFTLISSLCIFLNSQSTLYYTNATSIIQCQQNCLQCDLLGNCLKCATLTANYLGVCVTCQPYCKSCLFRNTSICTSCHQGFYFNQTTCVKCKQPNCQDCSTFPDICIGCINGFYLFNKTCLPCTTQNCLSCDFTGKCIKCSSGFTLLGNNSCQQCAGNCRQCNSSVINQCFVACNLTSYQMEGKCYACPISCRTCVSSQVCLSCNVGFQMRNSSCVQPCLEEGCFRCDPQNSSMCIECFSGYLITQNATCTADLSCNSNQNCTQCPKKWTLINNKCQSCNLTANCTQCGMGNRSLCIQCQGGFYLNGSNVCVRCGTNCLKCMYGDLCLECGEGFFVPSELMLGNCSSCDSNCKTCSQSATKCLTCNQGYQLSVSQKCISALKINATIQLNLQFSSFLGYSRPIRSDLLGLMGDEYRNQNRLYIITELKEGSTVLGFYLAIPDGKDPDQTFSTFRDNILKMPLIGGAEIISIKKIQVVDTTKIATFTFFGINDTQLNKLAIILGVVIPSVVIILVIVGCVIKKRLSAQPNNVINNAVGLALDDTKGQVEVNKKTKLPPIPNRPLPFNTPVKQQSANHFGSTANNDTFLITPQQQSYEQFFENNDENKPEVVNEFYSKEGEHVQNHLNLNEISDIKEEEEKRNELQLQMRKNKISRFDDTLRQMEEKKGQKELAGEQVQISKPELIFQE